MNPILNRMYADLETLPPWYETEVRLGDVIEVVVVMPDQRHLVLRGRVTAVGDHGHFQDLRIGRVVVRLWLSGPRDTGVVACRVISRWRPRLQPERYWR